MRTIEGEPLNYLFMGTCGVLPSLGKPDAVFSALKSQPESL